ncbi:MAG: prepilin-type N-terminal cleavage/methylation domain-containing protein [Desulfobacteraceae bacterium]|nr:prepilin-type N-terminal cleavage/methylation domain-containing protein [Desulfobacteraceae bacterium]
MPAKNDQAFTLIELIVVITLLGVMLFFAGPRIHESFFSSDSRKLSAWLQLQVKDLKNRAVENQMQFILFVDIDENRLWAGRHDMDEPALEAAKSKGLSLSGTNRISEVVFAGDHRISAGTAQIRFYPRGYSDQAVIYVQTRGNQRISHEINPFLPDIKTGGSHE